MSPCGVGVGVVLSATAIFPPILRWTRAVTILYTYIYIYVHCTCPRSTSRMEELLRKELSATVVKSLGRSSGGCISDGQSFEVDSGRIFVKHNVDKNVGVA